MVEVFSSLVTTAISTIIIVTMATIFFCCWRKKGDGDITDGKTKKDKVNKEGSKKERSVSPASAASSRPENGIAESRPFVDSQEDLGDFSAVQRETEILRSYRKPPPPKNRARQSRAPRQFKSSTENLDIFTELSEENSLENKENIAVKAEIDSSLMRPRTGDKEANTRDARSSMLADIEQTLAALHMSEQQTQPLSPDTPPLKDVLISPTESLLKGVGKGKGDEDSNKPADKSESLASSQSGDASSKLSETPVVSVEPNAESSSPKSSPITKPKIAPKVSPKPSPKVRAKFSAGEKLAASDSLKVPSENGQSESSEALTAQNTRDSQADSASAAPLSSPSENTEPSETKVSETITAMAAKIVSQVTAEAIKNTGVSGDLHDQVNTDSDVKASNKDIETNSGIRAESEEKKGSTKSSKSPVSTPNADVPKPKEKSRSPESITNADAVTNGSLSNGSTEAQVNGNTTPGKLKTSPERQTSDGSPERASPPSKPPKSPISSLTSPIKSENGKPDLVTQQDPESASAEDDKQNKSEEPGKQRRESADDQSGKKTSKIPVRAGCKQ